MSFVSFEPMIPHLPEARRLLREKYKFSARETEELISKVFWSFGKEHAVQPKNPRRALLDVVRKFAAAKRREEKAWATRNKGL